MGGVVSQPLVLGVAGFVLLFGRRVYRGYFTTSQLLKLSALPSNALSSTESPLTSPKPSSPRTLLEYAALVLNTPSIEDKYALTLEAKRKWHGGAIPIHDGGEFPVAPSTPARPTNLITQDSRAMDQRSAVKDASLSRLLLVHSLCHIEAWAIDLSWDVLLRFAGSPLMLPDDKKPENGLSLPDTFFEDWLRIATEEARHWNMWRLRLVELQSSYGAFPVHDGLWQSAQETSHDFLARLAVVHMTHEARGLDVTPRFLAQMHSAGDIKSANLLKMIEEDEITHVASGMTWFRYACLRQSEPLDPIPTFHGLVRRYFRGSLKPPFCIESRHKAGFTEEWYIPLATSESAHHALEAAKKRELKIKQKAEAREKAKMEAREQARARNSQITKSQGLQEQEGD